MNLELLPNETEQINLIIQSISNQVSRLLINQDFVTLAVSGGKSPIPLFKKLSNIALPWEKIKITLVDERLTNPDSADSNENLVQTYLLQNQAAKAQFLRIISSDDKTVILERASRWVNQIDIAILGMGEDGHTASIFPNCTEFVTAIDKNAKAAYIETNPTTAKYTRIGLNLSALIQIKHLIVSISGEAKLKVIQEAAKTENKDYPISYLIKNRPDIHVFTF